MTDVKNESIIQLDDDFGHAEVSPRQGITAGEYGTWLVEYTAGPNGIKVGGSVRIIPPVFGYVHWEIGKVTAFCDNPNVHLECQASNMWPRTTHHSNYPVVTVIVYGEKIEAGETITVKLGDQGGYNSGRFVRTRAQEWAGRTPFMVSVDPIGNARFEIERANADRYHKVDGDLWVEVEPAEPEYFRVSLKNPGEPGAPLRVTITCEDEYENPVRGYEGRVRLSSTAHIEGLPETVQFTADDEGHKHLQIPAPELTGPVWVTAWDGESEAIGTSNPLQPGFFGDLQAYFGDLHVMTGQNHEPKTFMWGDTETGILYARDDRGMDFTSITNTGGQWPIDGEMFAKYNDPKTFVTIPGREFGFSSGHKNVYTMSDEWEAPRPSGPADLPEMLKDRDAIVITHHPNTHSETDPTNWGPANLDSIIPELEPVIEICQNRGSFEKEEVGEDNVYFGGFGSSVQSALAMDYRLGFVGGTDNHRGLPASGRSHQSGLNYDEYVTGGITCVLCEKLTREAIFEAIRERRCYATTGQQILVDFSVNGQMMGREVAVEEIGAENEREIAFKIAGTTAIEKIVVVRNNEDVHTITPEAGTRFVQGTWTDETPFADAVNEHNCVYYYLRITQKNGHLAWPSPVWIDG
ncbi:MAG: DUF3604 domain-containing protein [Armatimonadota bacterium]